jgi:hypothetical protein
MVQTLDRLVVGTGTATLERVKTIPMVKDDTVAFPSWVGDMENTFGRVHRIYIAGPMRGYPEFNFPAFDEAAAMMRDLGWLVRSPADHDRQQGFDPARDLEMQPDFDIVAAFRWDIATLLDVDAVYFLDGWEASQGANTEHAIAVSIGIQRFYQTPRDEVQFMYLPHVAFRRVS